MLIELKGLVVLIACMLAIGVPLVLISVGTHLLAMYFYNMEMDYRNRKADKWHEKNFPESKLNDIRYYPVPHYREWCHFWKPKSYIEWRKHDKTKE